MHMYVRARALTLGFFASLPCYLDRLGSFHAVRFGCVGAAVPPGVAEGDAESGAEGGDENVFSGGTEGGADGGAAATRRGEGGGRRDVSEWALQAAFAHWHISCG